MRVKDCWSEAEATCEPLPRRGEVLDTYDKIQKKESKGNVSSLRGRVFLLVYWPPDKETFVGIDAGIDRCFDVVVYLPLAIPL